MSAQALRRKLPVMAETSRSLPQSMLKRPLKGKLRKTKQKQGKNKAPKPLNKEDALKKLGVRIRELRIKKGHKSYEYFAYENNISRAQFGRYEKGADIPADLECLKYFAGMEQDCWPCICWVAEQQKWHIKGC